MDAHEENGVAERLKAVADALEEIVADRSLLKELSLEERTRLLALAGDVHNPDVVQRRRFNKVVRREKKAARLGRDESVLAETGIRVHAREAGVHDAERLRPEGVRADRRRRRPSSARSSSRSTATSARSATTSIHPFYDQLCPPCARLQLRASARRPPTSSGRVALLTGGRVKIGYQAGIKLLRAGAQLIVTTRFPRDCGGALRGRSRTSTSGATGSRSSGSICATRRASRRSARTCCATRERLDFIVNNACQTVRRPPDFYRHMLERGDGVGGVDCPARRPRPARRLRGAAPHRHAAGGAQRQAAAARRCHALGRALAGAAAAGGSRVAARPLPRGPARRRTCSRSTCASATRGGCLLAEVPTVELLEVQLVNAVAPFVLNARLKPLHAADARARQAHRQRLGGRGAVLPPLQDRRGTRTRTWPRRR